MVFFRTLYTAHTVGFALAIHDDVALLQTRDPVTSKKMTPLSVTHVRAVGHSMRHSKDFSGTSTMFAQYAETVVRDGATIDDDSKTALSDMKDSLTADTQKYLTDNHASDQELLNTAAERVKSCNSDLVPKKAADDIAVSNSVKAGGTHANCREQLADIIAKKGNACQELDDFIAGIGQCASLPTERSAVKGFYVTLGSIHNGQNTWAQLDEKCSTSETEEIEKDATCDGLQETFESGMCQVRLGVHTNCATHRGCFDTANAEYLEVQKSVETNEAGRKVDWVAIEKLKCYIDVLVSDAEADDRSEELKSCQEQEADTAALNIQYPELSEQLDCSVSAVESYPCTDDFANGYSGMAGLLECTDCQALPAWLEGGGGSAASGDNCGGLDGGNWNLVRHVPAGNKWHPATDQLLGTDVYGNPDGPLSDQAWTTDFSDTSFTEFLFASGDCEHWLIATKESVIGIYGNELRPIKKSSKSDSPTTARWYRRPGAKEDPWISTIDHGPAIGEGEIVYGENNFGSTHASAALPMHQGANVFIRP